MEKKRIRKMAFFLVLLNLLSLMKVDKSFAYTPQRLFYLLDKYGRLMTVDDKDIVRTNFRTFVEEGEEVYIFDRDNALSHQYGANQNIFRKDFDYLIKDSYIWANLQRYYPVESFSSYENAMDFYKVLFRAISDCGCGYAAVADVVFKYFEGREEEFEKTFGYSMYRIEEDGVIEFNYPLFIIDLFNFSVLFSKNTNQSEIVSLFDKSLAFLEYLRFSKSDEYVNRRKDLHATELKGEELLAYVNHIIELEDKYLELQKRYYESKDKYTSLGLPDNVVFGHVKEYLASYGIDIQVMHQEGVKTIQAGNIIASDGADMYKEDEWGRYSEIDNMPSHYVYVVGVRKDGKIIVSSWGQRFIFDNSEAKWTDKIVLTFLKK